MPIDVLISTITLFCTLVLSFFVFIQDSKNNVNKSFFLLGLSISLWIFSNVLISILDDYNLVLFFSRTAIIWVALLPILFNRFIRFLYLSDNKEYKGIYAIISFISYLITFLFIILNQTTFNIKTVTFTSWGVDYQPGYLYYVLLFYLIIGFGFPLFHLLKTIQANNSAKRRQIMTIIIGVCLTVIVTIFTDIILPIMGYGIAALFGPPSVLIFLLFIAYSITKHRLFNIRVIAIEIVTFAIWITLLIRIFIAETQQDLFVSLGLLITTIIFGILLIRSTINEIVQLEHIDKLTEELRKTYASVHQLNDALDRKIAVRMEEKSTVDKVWKGTDPENGSSA